MVYVVVAFFGASANHRLAVAWAKAFAGPDGFFARQFAACGAGAAEAGREGVAVPLVKESASCYKFYASGRRFCEGEGGGPGLRPGLGQHREGGGQQVGRPPGLLTAGVLNGSKPQPLARWHIWPSSPWSDQ